MKILYTPEELDSIRHQENTLVIDIREEVDYAHSHIPGAVNVPEVFHFLSTSDPKGMTCLHETFQKSFRNAGVTANKKTVFYEESLDTRYGSSCRGYWLLTYLGHPDAAILDGGFLAWCEKNLPVDNHQVRPEPSAFKVSPQTSMIATKDEVYATLEDPGIILLDNRDQSEWRGEISSPYGIDYCPRKGRIPGAKWIEWYGFMDRSQKVAGFKPKDAILSLCASQGIYPDSHVILYCFKGSRAALTYVAMKLAGFINLRVYFASWNEWSRHAELKADTTLL